MASRRMSRVNSTPRSVKVSRELRYPDVTAIAARSLAELGGGGNGECLCQLPVDAMQQHQILDQQTKFLSAGGDLLAYVFEDIEQIGALAHEDLRLGAAQVPVAESGDLRSHRPVRQGIPPGSGVSCPRSSKLDGSTRKSASVR